MFFNENKEPPTVVAIGTEFKSHWVFKRRLDPNLTRRSIEDNRQLHSPFEKCRHAEWHIGLNDAIFAGPFDGLGPNHLQRSNDCVTNVLESSGEYTEVFRHPSHFTAPGEFRNPYFVAKSFKLSVSCP